MEYAYLPERSGNKDVVNIDNHIIALWTRHYKLLLVL